MSGPGQPRVVAVPTLDELASDPTKADALPPQTTVALLSRCTTAQAALMARLVGAAATNGRTLALAPADTEARLLTVPKAAERLGIPPSYLYELIRLGRVPATKIGPKYVRLHPITVAEIQQRGLDDTLSQQYSPSRDRQGASSAAPGPDASGVRRSARRPREHAGAVRARRAGDSGAGGPAGADGGG